MNGNQKENPEVKPLDEDDMNFFDEDENNFDALDKCNRIHHGYKHECPRCGSIQTVASRYPYCTGCNWDSLTDVLEAHDEWAA